MTIDMHTHAGRPHRTAPHRTGPHRTGDVARAVLGTMRPACVARTETADVAPRPEIPTALRDRGLARQEGDKPCFANWLRAVPA